MRQDLNLVGMLCLLPFTLAVTMATEDTENRAASLPLYIYDGSQAVPGPKPEQPTTLSSSSDTDAEGERPRVSLSGKEEQDGKSAYALPESKAKIPEVEARDNVRSKMVVSPFKPDDDHITGRLLVAVARTLVTSTASTTTVTVLSTCHDNAAVAVGTLPVCAGKKKRRLILFNPETAIADTSLESSLRSEPVLFDKPIEREGRFIIWSSSVTTVLFTATSTAVNVIISARYMCSFAGIVTCVAG